MDRIYMVNHMVNHDSRSLTYNISDFENPASVRVMGSCVSSVGLKARGRLGKFLTISNSFGLKGVI